MMDWIIIDIETKVVREAPSVEDEFRLLAYCTNDGQFGVLTNLIEVNQLLRKFYTVIGFNIEGYDLPILKKYSVWIPPHVIDLYTVVKKKQDVLPVDGLMSFSLSSLAGKFKLAHQKTEFDYKLLCENDWMKHFQLIKNYAINDILVTQDLWNYIQTFFEPFKYGLSQSDISLYKHITMSTSVYAYRVVCRKAGIREEYADVEEDYKGRYAGGFVSEPSDELVVGDIVCLDFKSAYPHAYMQANLFSHSCKCCPPKEKWRGSLIFKEIKGEYCTKTMGRIESAIKELYLERIRFRAIKDPTQYAIKIALNTIYGICGNPAFKNVYNLNTASDCTYICRAMIQYARAVFEASGCKIIYSDTDSIYLERNGTPIQEILYIKDHIIKAIQSNLPFPQTTFDMELENEISLIYFPKKLKKNYLYLTKDGKVVVKGLKIIKENKMAVSNLVFEKRIKPKIILERKVVFESKQIKDWVEEEISQDLELATILVRVKEPSFYKMPNQLQRQISERYGPGAHKLIPNFRTGVGKGVRFCTIQEFKAKELSIKDINLTQAYNELQPFADHTLECKTIINRGKKKRVINTLEEWIC